MMARPESRPAGSSPSRRARTPRRSEQEHGRYGDARDFPPGVTSDISCGEGKDAFSQPVPIEDAEQRASQVSMLRLD